MASCGTLYLFYMMFLTSFEPVSVYRLITRQVNEQDNIEITDKDFLSQIEKNPLPPRGIEAKDYIGNIGNYSCSFSKTKEWLYNVFKLPKKTKFFIKGNINPKHGVICEKPTPHIHCWIYEGVSLVKDFTIEKENA